MIDAVREALYTDGFAALRGAFSREWVAEVRADLEVAFAEAIARPGGAVPRGPERYYVEIHPGQPLRRRSSTRLPARSASELALPEGSIPTPLAVSC